MRQLAPDPCVLVSGACEFVSNPDACGLCGPFRVAAQSFVLFKDLRVGSRTFTAQILIQPLDGVPVVRKKFTPRQNASLPLAANDWKRRRGETPTKVSPERVFKEIFPIGESPISRLS